MANAVNASLHTGAPPRNGVRTAAGKSDMATGDDLFTSQRQLGMGVVVIAEWAFNHHAGPIDLYEGGHATLPCHFLLPF